MPKETFYKLPNEKRQLIEETLFHEFSTHPISKATVKNIVERLGISRGSFYQYFDSLEESYFYLLEQETSVSHRLFYKRLLASHLDWEKTLTVYGDELAEELFKERTFAIYKHRYLDWTVSLDSAWKEYIQKNTNGHSYSHYVEDEKIHFIKAIIHTLIQRMYSEKWTKEQFLEQYQTCVKWILGGITNDSTH